MPGATLYQHVVNTTRTTAPSPLPSRSPQVTVYVARRKLTRVARAGRQHAHQKQDRWKMPGRGECHRHVWHMRTSGATTARADTDTAPCKSERGHCKCTEIARREQAAAGTPHHGTNRDGRGPKSGPGFWSQKWVEKCEAQLCFCASLPARVQCRAACNGRAMGSHPTPRAESARTRTTLKLSTAS